MLAWRIASALLMGLAVVGIYLWARRGEEVQATFVSTLVLLAAVIAMSTQVIGDNVARAFSLVGALSVVRFRTVVKDTQDTAFVIFTVVVGMAAGANHITVALVGLGVIGVAAIFLWPPRRGSGGWERSESVLCLRVGLSDAIRAAVEAAVEGAADRCDLSMASTARQGSSLELTYRIRLRPDCSPARLVSDLNMLEGVESVDLRLRRAD
jgi:hypothetical protein